MYSQIYRKILFPFYETVLRGRSTLNYLKLLNNTQWYSTEKLKLFQWERVQKLLHHAYRNVPYYKKVFTKIGLHPEDIKTPSEIINIPVLTKEIIRNNKEELLARDIKKNNIFNDATGGSTGIPLQFYLDHNNYEWRYAKIRRTYGWAGYKDGERTIFIWPGAIGKTSFFKKMKKNIDEKLKNHKFYYNDYYFNKDTINECVNGVNRFKPKYIISYTWSLYDVAVFIKENRIKIFSPESIIVAAEKLLPFQRETIQGVFGCPVFETYGCRELGSIAGECEKHDGMHLNMEAIFLEIVKENENVENGELVLTDLTNYCMPFIRYKNEDMGSFSDKKCECGRGLVLLKNIEGRIADAIKTPDGRIISGVFFPQLMKEFNWVKRFQVVQESLDRLTLKIVKDALTFKDSDFDFMNKKIFEVMGGKINIDINFVEEIPLTKSGKYRVSISNIKTEKNK